MSELTIASELQRKVSISNQLGDYPPYNLSKIQYQALLVLVAYIDSKAKPVYGIDDLKEEIERQQIPRELHMDYVERVVLERNTYRIPASEVLRYFTDGKTPRGGVIKRVLGAIDSLDNYKIKSRHPNFANEDFEGAFSWFDRIGYDKKKDEILFTIGLSARQFLMGLDGNFLQLLAESTLKFDGKYSVPIFMYMKRKLFHGEKEYHGQEPVADFLARFGLDEIKTYHRFYELERRILKVAEKDSTKSGDISFKFEGIAKSGSRKITILKYHIYRIGNIHKPLTIAAKAAKKAEREVKLQQVLALSKAQKMAYDFLVEKGINRHFILDNIINHAKIDNPKIHGYEDLFFELLWNKFSKASKAKKLAGAFVSWWKQGILHRDGHFFPVLEQLYERQKKLSEGERTYRKIAHGMTAEEYQQYRDQLQTERQQSESSSTTNQPEVITKATKSLADILPRKQKSPFSIGRFRMDYPAIYAQIKTEIEDSFVDLKDALEQSKFDKMVGNRVENECEKYYKGL
ncbi:MAG: replication initiation protein [Saprospiraceae bacterium]